MSVNRTNCSTPDLEKLGIDLGQQFPPPRPSANSIFAPASVAQSAAMQAQVTTDHDNSRFSDYETDATSTLYHPAGHGIEPRNLEEGVASSSKSKATNKLNVLLKLAGRTQPKLLRKADTKSEHVCHCYQSHKKRKNRRNLCTIILVVFLLYALANLIFLNTRIMTSRSESDSKVLSTLEEACLTQFQINAPNNASAYPCSTCLPILQGISPGSLSGLTTNSQQAVSNGIQFCGLQSLFSASSASAQTSLADSGSNQNVQVCTWSGVACNSNGTITTLQMQFPSVPSVITDGIGALTAMQSLKIIGGNGIPAGSVPDAFANLASLTSLDLEDTALTSFVLNGSLSGLTSLTLVKNTAMDVIIPDVDSLKLQSLVVNNQTLPLSLDSLLNSANLQSSLKTLSLTSVPLNAAIPSTIAEFTSLTELHLDGDGLQEPLPTALPKSLQILTLADNPTLAGATPPSVLCASMTLQNCTLTGDNLAATQGGCGVCTFS